MRFVEWVDQLRQRAQARAGNAPAALGARGEDVAHRYLERCGMVVIARNWRRRAGGAELDLVARDGDALVVVEVKTRATDAFGAPERAIGEEKRSHLQWAALDFARDCGEPAERLRFDVVGVLLGGAEPVITHQKDAWGRGDAWGQGQRRAAG